MINRRSFIKSVGAGAAAMLVPSGLTQAAIGEHTNVILIMSDDTGYETFGCYGSEQYKTPRIDELAKQACDSITVTPSHFVAPVESKS